jgi:hypothetical protein
MRTFTNEYDDDMMIMSPYYLIEDDHTYIVLYQMPICLLPECCLLLLNTHYSIVLHTV